ncbi:MAG: hypothetical protein C0485_17755 [Pirellula sp.]|nr:hypothetical protein [Pirellula sp.]
MPEDIPGVFQPRVDVKPDVAVACDARRGNVDGFGDVSGRHPGKHQRFEAHGETAVVMPLQHIDEFAVVEPDVRAFEYPPMGGMAHLIEAFREPARQFIGLAR